MMAGRSQHSAMKHAYRLFSPGMEGSPTGLDSDEFEESDVWGYEAESRAAEFRKPIPAARASARKKGDRGATTAAGSLPVNIPDWSKILREEYGGKSYRSRVLEEEEEEEGDGTGAVIPPHELLWKSRAASLSVQEGIGRTLKGRDLSRVRNAIWEKTGFQD